MKKGAENLLKNFCGKFAENVQNIAENSLKIRKKNSPKLHRKNCQKVQKCAESLKDLKMQKNFSLNFFAETAHKLCRKFAKKCTKNLKCAKTFC